MFMRVNSKCAHQVRPPPGRIRRSAAVGYSCRDSSAGQAWSMLSAGPVEAESYDALRVRITST